MALFFQSGKYGNMNTTYYTTMGYYVITFVSEAYTLQEHTACYVQISTAGELFFKTQYLNCMQENTKWYWEQKQQQNIIIVSTHTIAHPCLDVMVVKYVHDIPISVCNRNH